MTSRNVPRLRFKRFDEKWKKGKVSSFSNREDNKRIAVKEAQRHHGNVPYYGANGIQDYVDNFTHDGNHVLIAEDGANSILNYPIYYVSGKIWVNNHAHVLSAVDGKSDAKFLSNMFKSFNFYRYLVGNGRYKLNADVLMKLNIKIPSLSEQQHIGNFFSKLDHLVDLHSQKLEQLKNLKRGYLQKMFPQKEETVPRLRFSGFSGEWSKERLSSICKIETGSLNANEMVSNGKYDFYTSGVKVYKINSYRFNGEAITIAGNGANVGYMHLANGKFNAYQRTYVLQNIESDRLFVFYYVKKKMPRLIYANSRNGNIPYIVIDMLERLNIALPSMKEQRKIGLFFSKLDDMLDKESQKIDDLKQQKKAYLQKMFI